MWSCQKKFSHQLQGKLRTGNISSVHSLCLGSQVALSIDQRWKAAGDRGDAAQVIVADIPKHHALHFITAHPGRVHWVELLFLQCGKEALHMCIVAAAAGPTHALNELVTPEGREEHLAGKLAARSE